MKRLAIVSVMVVLALLFVVQRPDVASASSVAIIASAEASVFSDLRGDSLSLTLPGRGHLVAVSRAQATNVISVSTFADGFGASDHSTGGLAWLRATHANSRHQAGTPGIVGEASSVLTMSSREGLRGLDGRVGVQALTSKINKGVLPGLGGLGLSVSLLFGTMGWRRAKTKTKDEPLLRDVPREELFGHIFRRLRKSRKLRQKDVAEILGVSQSLVSQIENGDALPPNHYLVSAIADALGVTDERIRAALFIAANFLPDGEVALTMYNALDDSERGEFLDAAVKTVLTPLANAEVYQGLVGTPKRTGV